MQESVLPIASCKSSSTDKRKGPLKLPNMTGRHSNGKLQKQVPKRLPPYVIQNPEFRHSSPDKQVENQGEYAWLPRFVTYAKASEWLLPQRPRAFQAQAG